MPLLAERLRDGGWDRIAVVGAMPLESDMGLDRGFRVYKDTEFSSWFGSPLAVPMLNDHSPSGCWHA